MLGGLKKPTLKRTRAVAPADDFSFKNPIYKKKYLKFTPPAKRLKFSEEGKFVTLNPKNIAALTQALNPASDSLLTVVSKTPDATRLAELKKSLDDPTKYSAQQRQTLQREYDGLLTKLYGEAEPSSLVQSRDYTIPELVEINKGYYMSELLTAFDTILRENLGIVGISNDGIESIAEEALNKLELILVGSADLKEYQQKLDNSLDPEKIYKRLESMFYELKDDPDDFVREINELIADSGSTVDDKDQFLTFMQEANYRLGLGFFVPGTPPLGPTPPGTPPLTPPGTPPLGPAPTPTPQDTLAAEAAQRAQEAKDLADQKALYEAALQARGITGVLSQEPSNFQLLRVELNDGSLITFDPASMSKDSQSITVINDQDKSEITFPVGSNQYRALDDYARLNSVTFKPPSAPAQPPVVDSKQAETFFNDQNQLWIRLESKAAYDLFKTAYPNELKNIDEDDRGSWFAYRNKTTGQLKFVKPYKKDQGGTYVMGTSGNPLDQKLRLPNDIGNEMYTASQTPAQLGNGYVSHTSMFASPERRLQEQAWNEQEARNRAESVRRSMAETRRGPFWFLKKKGKGRYKDLVESNMRGDKKSFGLKNLAAHALVPGYTLAVGGYPGQAKTTKNILLKGNLTPAGVMNESLNTFKEGMTGKGPRIPIRRRPTGPKKPFDFAGMVEAGASSLFDNREAIASGLATGAKGLAGVTALGSLMYLNEKKKQAGGMKRFANQSKVGKFRLDPRSIKRSLGFGSAQIDTSALNFKL